MKTLQWNSYSNRGLRHSGQRRRFLVNLVFGSAHVQVQFCEALTPCPHLNSAVPRGAEGIQYLTLGSNVATNPPDTLVKGGFYARDGMILCLHWFDYFLHDSGVRLLSLQWGLKKVSLRFREEKKK